MVNFDFREDGKSRPPDGGAANSDESPPQKVDCTGEDSLKTESFLSGSSTSIDPDAAIRIYGDRLQKVITDGEAIGLQRELRSIPQRYHERILFYLLESYQLRDAPEIIAANLPSFEGVDPELIAHRLLDVGERGAGAVFKFLTNFDGVNTSTLLAGLTRYPQLDPRLWLKNSDFFSPKELDTIISHLVDSGHIDAVVELVPRIAAQSHGEIAEKIIARWEQSKQNGMIPVKPPAQHFIRHINRFQGISAQEVLERIITLDSETAVSIAINLDLFPNVDTRSLAQQLRRTAAADPRNSSVLEAVGWFIESSPNLTRAERLVHLFDMCPEVGLRKRIYQELFLAHFSGEKVRLRLEPELYKDEYGFLDTELSLSDGMSRLDEVELAKLADAMKRASKTIRSEMLEEACRAVVTLVDAGKLCKASSFLSEFGLTPSDIQAEIVAEISSLCSEDAPALNPESIGRLLAISGWSLLEPGVLEQIGNESIRARFLRYRGVFGDPSPREVQHLRRYELLDIFLENGVPILSAHGMIREENLRSLSRVVPALVRETGSADAWATHARHLATMSESLPGCGLEAPEMVERELNNLLVFYRMFHGACAPRLYTEFRSLARNSLGLGGGGAGNESLLEWRSSFEEAVLCPHPDRSITWDEKAIEYLDAWTRSRGVIQERGQWIRELSSGPVEQLRVKPREISVVVGAHNQGSGVELGSGVIQGYRALTDIISSLQGSDRDALHLEEQARLVAVISQYIGRVDRWLRSDQAAEAPSWVRSQRVAEVERLFEVRDRVRTSGGTPELLRLLLNIDHRLVSPSIARLAMGEALYSLRDPMEFYQLLEGEASDRSVRALGEFMRNQLFDETFEALSLSKSERKIVRKALPSFDIGSVIRAQGEYDAVDTRPSQNLDVIHVYPTRGILAEFAGSFADACWTDKTDLMKRHPNAMALVFVSPEKHECGGRNGTPSKVIITKSLVGACYLLHVKDLGGDDVLVLRGINPRERPFERVKIGSFIEALLDEVVVPYARELGAKKVVVPFDELGHAQTNRLRVGAYLQEQYGQMPFVPLDPKGPSTNFNNRRIFDKCRLVRVVE